MLQALKQQIAALEEHVHHLELDNRKRVVSLKGGKNNLNRQTSTGYVCSLHVNEVLSAQCVNRHCYGHKHGCASPRLEVAKMPLTSRSVICMSS